MVRLAVALGDPTGIGPEVLAKALAAPLAAAVLLIGDAATWEEAQRIAQVYLPLRPARRPDRPADGSVPFLDVPVPGRAWRSGEMSPAGGRAAVAWLERAVTLALTGEADAVVFAPLNKAAIVRAGYAVRDEYDLCARWTNATDHSEMNVIPHPAGPGLLWVARVTAHIALAAVAGSLSIEGVLRTIRLAHRTAARAGGTPRLGVAALNPHAGEDGLLGDEEERVIRPALEAARGEGIDASGPYPADHIFRLARDGRFDVVVAMYHDQAQIATKLLGFEQGVSVGVGYPFVLATPSHGTAFDITGRGVADPRPMRQTLELAARLAAG